MWRRIMILTVLAALLIAFVGVTPTSAAPPMLPGMDQMENQMAQDIATLKGLTGKDFEIAFMQMMIAHHQSALEMAQLVPGRATHPELIALGQNIIAAQQQEIAQMRGWLKDWYGVANPTIMPVAGMDQVMTAMRAMTGAEFEQAFLTMMPMHHQSAINMAALVPGRATHPELLQLGQNITSSQSQEIEQMRGWAMAWYGFDPKPMSQGGTPVPATPMPATPMPGTPRPVTPMPTMPMPTAVVGGSMFQQQQQSIQELRQLTGKDLEVGYINRIVPHHQGALQMAQIIVQKAPHQETRDAAAQIIKDQQMEIGELTSYLQQTYQQPVQPDARFMMPPTMLQQLRDASPEMSEVMFLLMIREHHQSAIQLGEPILQKAAAATLKDQAQRMIDSQRQQQVQFANYLKTWYGIDAPVPTGNIEAAMQRAMQYSGPTMPGLPNTGGGGMAQRAIGLVPTAITALGALLLAGWWLLRRRMLPR